MVFMLCLTTFKGPPDYSIGHHGNLANFLVLRARYLGIVWTLVATGLDGIVFWGPIIIHTILDTDSASGRDLLINTQHPAQMQLLYK